MTHENEINATDEPNESRSLINRRAYLKGTVTAAAVAAGAFSTATSAQEYDTITVPANTRHNITVGSGETLENLLIDMTASGASAHITTQGSDWTIRNVGFKGNHPGGHYLMTPGVSSSSGHGLIENVYLGDGQTEHSESGGIWINANLPHRGTITFRNIHVAHMIDNGLYGSGPGAQGYNGNAHVEDSYFLSNNISNIRLSSRGPESSVTNCTVEVDGTTRECGVGCSSWGAVNNRGVWAWYGNVDIIDSNIQGSLNTSSGGSYTLINTQTGGSADTTPPDGVPMTAEEAASGGDSIVGDGDAHEFEIEGQGEFYLEVDEVVEPDPSIAPYTTYGQTHGDDWVSFELSSSGSTHWWFKDEIVQLDFTENQTVYIDGEEYDDGSGGSGGGEPTVVDDFERSSPLSEYGGADSLFSVETSTVYEGSQALVNDSGSFGSAVSTSGLSDYPGRGDEVHVHFTNAGDDNFVSFHLFAQSEVDNPGGYTVGISSAGAWRMWRNDGGTLTQIANESLSSSEQISGWYRAEIWTDSSTVYADLYDDASDTQIASIQANDTTYSSGGIGFRSAGNGEVWDYAIVPGDEGPPVVDDFERSNPLSDYGGATSLFSTTSSTVYEGSTALVNDGGSFGSVASTSGLNNYPSRGDAVDVHFTNASDDNFVAFHLFAQSEVDNPDGYAIGISSAGAWRMWRRENGTTTQIASDSLSSSEQISGWYRAEISSDSSTVYADLYDDSSDTLLSSIQASDTTYSSGGIGFRSAGNGEVWDYVVR